LDLLQLLRGEPVGVALGLELLGAPLRVLLRRFALALGRLGRRLLDLVLLLRVAARVLGGLGCSARFVGALELLLLASLGGLARLLRLLGLRLCGFGGLLLFLGALLGGELLHRLLFGEAAARLLRRALLLDPVFGGGPRSGGSGDGVARALRGGLLPVGAL